MNFLVTGGCGYIGTILTKRLLAKNNKVTIVDNCWFGNFLKKFPSYLLTPNEVPDMICM